MATEQMRGTTAENVAHIRGQYDVAKEAAKAGLIDPGMMDEGEVYGQAV